MNVSLEPADAIFVLIAVVVLACVALVWHFVSYSRVGYPTIPRYLRISTFLPLADVRKALSVALQDGFEISRETDSEIIVVKHYESPSATIIARYRRQGIQAVNELEMCSHANKHHSHSEYFPNPWYGLFLWMRRSRTRSTASPESQSGEAAPDIGADSR
jgi:hypothetical protein